MVALFYKRSPFNPVLLFFFAIAVKLPLFIYPQAIELSSFKGTPLFYFVQWVQLSSGKPLYIFSILTFLILFAQALYLNYFFNRNKMTSRNTDLPGMSYLLMTSLLPEWSQFSAPLIINFLVLFLLSSLFESYHSADTRRTLYNMGLAMGLGIFIYPPALLLTGWFLLSLVIIRPVRIQEIIISLLGVLTPFYFWGIWLFWNDQLSWALIEPHIAFSIPNSLPVVWLGGIIFLLTIPFLIGFYHIQDQVRKMLIQVRRGWTVFFLLFLAGLFIPLFSLNPYTGWVILLLPLSTYHASFYYYTSFRIFPLLFFWVTFFFILLNQFSGSWGKVIFVP
ncbi:MAG TPA: hypothetical protein DCP55_05370 [Chitinophagaceae bacterium]|nr:hypothetical protein [Chitinophagaceae bacterium]